MTCSTQRIARDPYRALRRLMRQDIGELENGERIEWRKLPQYIRHQHLREYCQACPDGYVYTVANAMICYDNRRGQSTEGLNRTQLEFDRGLFSEAPGASIKAWILVALQAEYLEPLTTLWTDEQGRMRQSEPDEGYAMEPGRPETWR